MDHVIPKAEDLYQHFKQGVADLLHKYSPQDTHLIGIYSGGAWLAQRLQQDLQISTPLGFINTSFYRDDFHKIGLHSQVAPSQINFDLEHKHLILIDDILYTGRSVRAAINELFDYGRPQTINLAVLIDRGGRQLPIQADVCGGVFELPAHRYFELQQNQQHIFDITLKEVA
ncbi:bifunctional pyr operon transcriptional regulator/uracil phosphoribosyltransferase PyrR [Brackiella oedipodis]|uniref:bifunctional pyr operon transcriptional regulator/uracil phosphoribosyltransferase PyrR n=1 Tax=Brackiella oedipodis TaxID=124225 RepID=UPI00048E3C05|nr:bifunctional pyr operon transcriptional regulator/uracil phosphoribosyltransferase PyrR [Brackiella oedipodis]